MELSVDARESAAAKEANVNASLDVSVPAARKPPAKRLKAANAARRGSARRVNAGPTARAAEVAVARRNDPIPFDGC